MLNLTDVEAKKVKFIFSDRMSQLRNRYKTYVGLCNHIGVNEASMKDWASGKYIPNGMTLYAIARRTGVSLDWLFGLEAKHKEVVRSPKRDRKVWKTRNTLSTGGIHYD